MTDARNVRRAPRGAMPVIVLALAAFLVLVTVLSLQMRAGRDPALRPAAAAQPPKRILKRKIVVRRVIITDAPAVAASVPSSGASVASAAVAPAPAAPVTSAAPVQAAPVAAAPPPAPAPVTRTS